jgi:hypothetical protein
MTELHSRNDPAVQLAIGCRLLFLRGLGRGLPGISA